LYNRAVGYDYDAVKIFMPAGAKKPVYLPYVEHVPSSDVAANPAHWRDAWRVDAAVGKYIISDRPMTRRGADQRTGDDRRRPSEKLLLEIMQAIEPQIIKAVSACSRRKNTWKTAPVSQRRRTCARRPSAAQNGCRKPHKRAGKSFRQNVALAMRSAMLWRVFVGGAFDFPPSDSPVGDGGGRGDEPFGLRAKRRPGNAAWAGRHSAGARDLECAAAWTGGRGHIRCWACRHSTGAHGLEWAAAWTGRLRYI
jgi:hypothetical protein